MKTREARSKDSMDCITRRRFVKGATTTAAAFTIVPRHVLGGPGFKAPSDTVNMAGVGVGGMGAVYIASVRSENIAVLCDVDHDFAAKTFKEYPKAKVYKDYRRMLDQETGIDAVVIGTPDHTHAVIAMAAIQRGKHIYCAKPLTRTIYESRRLTKAAREAGVATQMSTQGQAEDGPRRLREMIWDGAIGPVREVHIWSDRPIWPQGLDRPEETPSVPSTLDWDLWLGPAPKRPYHPAYHPFKFRGWHDFGTGALGDMGCHGFDPIFRALKLGAPTSVHASSSKTFDETYPQASVIHYTFAARNMLPPVKLTWYDGGLKPQRPAELESGRELGGDGLLFIGDKGTILSGFTGQNPQLIPETKMAMYEPPAPSIPSSIGHYMEWVEACKGGDPAPCNFNWGGPLTEIVLLGNIALRTGLALEWDGEQGKFTNYDEANAYLQEPYRDGWSL